MPTYEIIDDVYKSYGDDGNAGARVGVQIKGPHNPNAIVADPNDSPIMVDFLGGKFFVPDEPGIVVLQNNTRLRNEEVIDLLDQAAARGAELGHPPGSVRRVPDSEVKLTIPQDEYKALLAEVEELRKGQARYNARKTEERVVITPEEAAALERESGKIECTACHTPKFFTNRGAFKNHCGWIVKHGRAASNPQEHAVLLHQTLTAESSLPAEEGAA